MSASFLEEESDSLVQQSTEDDISDPCHEYEHSVLFFLLLTGFVALASAYCYLLAKRRPHLYGYDLLHLLLFGFALVRFGPKLWGAVQIHGLRHASQSGCKLVAYTEFGLRSAIVKKYSSIATRLMSNVSLSQTDT